MQGVTVASIISMVIISIIGIPIIIIMNAPTALHRRAVVVGPKKSPGGPLWPGGALSRQD